MRKLLLIFVLLLTSCAGAPATEMAERVAESTAPAQTSAELAWIGNFALTLLHDSGAIGMLLFSIFLTLTVRGGLRDAKRLWERAPDAAVRLVGLCYGVLALLVAFLATTGFSFSYPWIALGLVGAHRRRARELLRDGADAPGLGRPSTAL